jgi:hypothetical protein
VRLTVHCLGPSWREGAERVSWRTGRQDFGDAGPSLDEGSSLLQAPGTGQGRDLATPAWVVALARAWGRGLAMPARRGFGQADFINVGPFFCLVHIFYIYA